MSTYDDASLIYYPSGYKASKAYSLKPTDGSGDLDFTRASTATRVNSAGLIESVATGVPRIDYTGAGCAKLLLEPQRTNLIFQSINFASWSRIGTPTVTSNYGISPSGIQDSTRVQGINGDRLYLAATGSSATYSYSIYVKGSGLLSITDSTGTYSLVITPTSNWVRHTLNFTAAFTNVQIRTLTVSDLEIYGAQIESGAYPTSLINTAGTAVTRTQDSASKTGISSLINSTEGVLYAEIKRNNIDTVNPFLISLSDGSNSNRAFIGYNTVSNQILINYFVSGVSQYSYTATVSDGFEFNKLALRYSNANFSTFINGVELDNQLSGSVLAPNILNKLGFDGGTGTAKFFGNVQNLMVFPSALSDTELATLTTL